MYKQQLPNIYFSGPSNFAPVFEKFLEFVSGIDKNATKYNILLILTDGGIHDMEETIATLVKLSEYPCSIIIIGIGDEDFSDMEKLDSDKKKLKDADGHVTKRDIVQFVPFCEVV